MKVVRGPLDPWSADHVRGTEVPGGPRSNAVQKLHLCRSAHESDPVDRENAVREGKTAGQKGLVRGPSPKGECVDVFQSTSTPPLAGADHDQPPAEPSDEDIWLTGVAQRVEADARPLFTLAWLWLFRRALELDEDEP